MTTLMYMDEAALLEAEVRVNAVEQEGDATFLVLDRTPFYPQGGGQPSDIGTIAGEGFVFTVSKAVLVDGVVHHFGEPLQGEPTCGDAYAQVDPQRRAVHAALHTGGHLVMTAMYELAGLRAVKGHHFPDGPYVTFEGVLDEDEKADLLDSLQRRLDEMVAADAGIEVESTTIDELRAEGVFMPAAVPTDKPTRVVTTFGYRSPCGGTHLERTGGLTGLKVRRLRNKAGSTRVTYELAEGE
jgi:Ser-tRNA(Ala) deacylase AlaX